MSFLEVEQTPSQLYDALCVPQFVHLEVCTHADDSCDSHNVLMLTVSAPGSH